MRNLVLKNKKNEVVRIFHCHTDKIYLLYRKKTGRLDLVPEISSFDKKKKEVQILKKINVNELKKNKASFFENYYLEIVDEVTSVPSFQVEFNKSPKAFWLSTAFVSGLFLISTTGLLLIYGHFSPKQEKKKIAQQVVKIIKPPPVINPEKVVIESQDQFIRDSKIKVTNKKVVKKSLKRMGALAALGSLSKDKTKQEGGLNLGASVVSSGPGLRALSSTSGSGGVQNTLYSKGMITAALGSGGNIKGGGGYGTKGSASGGGKAGYGQLVLTGSSGTGDLSETTAINLQGGGFDFSLIERKILQKSGEIHNCYDQALKFDSNLKGVFVSQFLIGKGGRVVSSQMHKTSQVKSKSLSDCILNVINQIKFDIKLDQKGLINVVFPFDLTSLGI